MSEQSRQFGQAHQSKERCNKCQSEDKPCNDCKRICQCGKSFQNSTENAFRQHIKKQNKKLQYYKYYKLIVINYIEIFLPTKNPKANRHHQMNMQ